MNDAWTTFQKYNSVPKLLQAQMNRALDALAGDVLSPAVDSHDSAGARDAAIEVAQSTLDLKLRYLSPSEIDLDRFELWSLQLLVDAESDNLAGVTGDVTTLEWIQDRFAHTIDGSLATKIDKQLIDLRSATDAEDLDKAIGTVKQLLDSTKQAKQ